MILFIDIETVPTHRQLAELSQPLQDLWKRKASFLHLTTEELDNEELTYRKRAGIYAEFSKIACISIGYINKKENTFHVKSIAGESEEKLLQEFATLLEQMSSKEVIFCGHNIREFDLPFICRRMIIHAIELPKPLNISGKKPWEIKHIDTMELWKFGDYKRYTSLDLLATILDVESSKNDINGSQVADVYYEENDLRRIIEYCQRDVVTTARVYFRLVNEVVNFTVVEAE